MPETTHPPSISILLVERLAMLRDALRGLIDTSQDIRIAAESGDYTDVIALMEAHLPDVIVFHLHAGDDDMVATMIAVTTHPDHPPMLVLTSDSPESATNRSALHAGASGLIEMKEPTETLLKAIRCVHSGELWIDRRTTAMVVQELRQQRNNPGKDQLHPKDMLSPREKEIVGKVAAGLSTEAIAEQLFISEKTVRNHLVSIYAKLDVSNRIQLALCASKMGIT